MADTALHRLRGILAATMTSTAIEQLLTEVRAETNPVHTVGDDGRSCRAVALTEAADLLDSVHGDNEHLARDWDWWDAATIPGSCAALLRSIAGDPPDQPIPYTLTEGAEPTPRPLWVDTSTYAAHGRLCTKCPLEIRSSDADYVAREMEQHLAEAHGRATVQPCTITVHLDAGPVLAEQLRRVIRDA